MAVSPRTIVSRMVLVLFGVCASLMVMEGALRVGALFAGRNVAEHPAWMGKWRVLCLGDSNTYGLYVEPSQAYPKVFERVWNATPGNASVEVLNLGFPGTNSSKLVKDFRRMLWTFRPDVVTVMIGNNDLWTIPETAAESSNVIDRFAAALWRMSRAYRFLYMVRRALQIRQLTVTQDSLQGFQHGHGTARYGNDEFELGWTQVPEGGIPGRQPDVELTKNLRSLAGQAADFGAQLVLLTYPADSFFYMWANHVTRDAAKVTGAPLIDVAAVLKAACPVPAGASVFKGPGADCPELFPDQHPTVIGHEKVGQILVQQLPPILAQAR